MSASDDPGAVAGELVVALSAKAAEAWAAGRDDLADHWASLAFAIRGNGTFHDACEHGHRDADA